jgi:hypothetical protein
MLKESNDYKSTFCEVEFDAQEVALIEYAAGFNGLGVDVEGRGVDEFIYRAVMDAVGEAVEATLEHPERFEKIPS